MQSVWLPDAVWEERGERFNYLRTRPFDLGQSVFQVVDFAPRTKIDHHYHKKTREVFVVLKGTGVLMVGDEVNILEPGSCFLIEPGDSHAITTIEGVQIAIFKPREHKEDIYWGRAE